MGCIVIREGERVRLWLQQHALDVEYVVLSERVDRQCEQRLGRLELGGCEQRTADKVSWWLEDQLAHQLGALRLRLRAYSRGGRRCLRAFSLLVECPSTRPAVSGGVLCAG